MYIVCIIGLGTEAVQLSLFLGCRRRASSNLVMRLCNVLLDQPYQYTSSTMPLFFLCKLRPSPSADSIIPNTRPEREDNASPTSISFSVGRLPQEPRQLRYCWVPPTHRNVSLSNSHIGASRIG